MILASEDLISHLMDQPWPGCTIQVCGLNITWMSSAIASMIIVAVLLAVFLLWVTRNWENVPHGPRKNMVEAVVVFVRDMIAKPALGERAFDFLPFLLTMFVFVLGLNLFGLVPLQPVIVYLGHHVPWLADKPMGQASTMVVTVAVGLASLTLLAILGSGWYVAARDHHEKTGRPIAVCLLMSPVLWFLSLSPHVPGFAGKVLLLPLALLELMGAMLKCVSMVIRLCANILAGHALLAVLMTLALQAGAYALEKNAAMWGVTLACVLGGAVANLLDLLVAALQAYIFTFLTATFLGLYVAPEH